MNERRMQHLLQILGNSEDEINASVDELQDYRRRCKEELEHESKIASKPIAPKVKLPLTWDDLANLYDKEHTGRKARTLPMDSVFAWAEKQTDKFIVDPEGSIWLVE